ncbi:hypothetical protein OESDEN_15533 [Oesophagostomum dentatum]|uniref:Uncharacterized protein n=1 Tax=Oesophagostomum dentatum TaxID=61180 RepID=A0A0B1SNI9_OESDE|nr:hypothetical protein OESDEN_15533 [Oesophagostomum dentatum]
MRRYLKAWMSISFLEANFVMPSVISWVLVHLAVLFSLSVSAISLAS